jgi:hypothetical protein
MPPAPTDRQRRQGGILAEARGPFKRSGFANYVVGVGTLVMLPQRSGSIFSNISG